MPRASEYFRDRVRILDLQFELENGVPKIAIVKEPATAVPSTTVTRKKPSTASIMKPATWDFLNPNLVFRKSKFDGARKLRTLHCRYRRSDFSVHGLAA
jgi:hypothetical protein